jgi:hypothetical protein
VLDEFENSARHSVDYEHLVFFSEACNLSMLTIGLLPCGSTQSTAKIAVKANPTSHDRIADFSKAPVSPTGSVEDEILVLRARNKILTEALSAVKKSASKEMKRRFDLVWFARYRCKYQPGAGSMIDPQGMSILT